MKKKYLTGVFFLTMILCFCFPETKAQTTDSVKNLRYYFEYPNIIVTFDLIKDKEKRKHDVSLEAETKDGKILKPSKVSGDIGEDIPAGENKKIKWNIVADVRDTARKTRNSLDVKCIVKAKTLLTQAEKDSIRRQKELARKKRREEQLRKERAEARKKLESIEVPGIMGGLFLSSIWPGWGAARYKEDSKAGLWGLLGYSSIGGYLLFHKKAIEHYDDYKSASNPDERQSLYDKAKQANDISMNFIYGATAVWTIEYIHVLISGVKAKKEASRKRQRIKEKYPKLDMSYSIDPFSKSAMLSFSYRF